MIQKRLTWPEKEANDRILEMRIKLQDARKGAAVVQCCVSHAGAADWG